MAEEALLVRSLDYGDDRITCYHWWSVKHRQKNGVFLGGENASVDGSEIQEESQLI